MQKKCRRVIAFLIGFLLIFEQSGFAQVAGSFDLSPAFRSLGNSFVQDKFRPMHLRFLSYDNKADNFRLMLDKGDAKNINNAGLEDSTKTLLKYFFIGISIPNDKFWVNLRPDADNNIIDPILARTDAGKILLEADLQLKKDTASATSPKTPEGKEYWDKLYKKAAEIFGSDSVSIPTLTRPWIVPGEIIIRETDNNAYVYKATLKVMLEQDYLKGSDVYNFKDPRQEKLNEYSSELIRQTIIPKLTKEINTSKRYAPLRQLYYSLILAQWFKSRFRGKHGIYAQSIDKERLSGLTSQEIWSKATYFKEYQSSFKNGEYNLKVPMTTASGQVIRSFFSGGIKPLVEQMPLPPSASSPVRVLGPVTTIYATRGFPAGSKAIASVDITSLKPSVNDPLSGMVITEDNSARTNEELSNSSSPVESDMTRRSWLAAVMGGAVAVAVGTKLNQAGRSSVIKEEGPAESPDLKEEVNIWGGYPAGEQAWLNFRDNSNLPAELQKDIYGTNRDGRHNLNNLYIAVVFALLSKTDPFFAVAHYIQEGREDAGMNFDIPGAVLNEEFWVNVVQPRYKRVYGKEIPFSMDSWSGILSDPYLGPFIYRSIVEEKIADYPEELAFRSNDFVAANKTNDIRMSAKSIQLYQGFGSISSGNGKFINYRKEGPHQYQYGYSVLAIMRMLQQGENRKIMDEVIRRAKENIPASMIEKISELDGGIEPFILPAGNVNGRFVETLNFNVKAKPEGLENAEKKSGVKQVKPENGLFLTGGKIISTTGWLSMATGASVYAVKFIADWRNESIARQSEDFTLEEFNAARDRVLAAKGLNSLDVLHRTVLVVVVKDRLDRQLGRVATLREIYNQIERMLPSQLESIVDEFDRSISDDEDFNSSGGGSASSPVNNRNPIPQAGGSADNYRKMIKNIKTPDDYRRAVMHFRRYDRNDYLMHLTGAERDLLDNLLQAKRLELGVEIDSEIVLILQNLYDYLAGKGLADEKIGSLDINKLELLGWRIRSAQSGDPRVEPLNERDLISFPEDTLNKDDLENLKNLGSDPLLPSGQVSSPVEDKKGGIDFRALPIMKQPMQNIPAVTSGSLREAGVAFSTVNTGKEWQEIQNMLNAGIMPSAQRIKDYVGACYTKNGSDKEIDKILICIADIFRMEEDKVIGSEPVFKDLLVLVESKSNTEELVLGLHNIKVYSREPGKIE